MFENTKSIFGLSSGSGSLKIHPNTAAAAAVIQIIKNNAVREMDRFDSIICRIKPLDLKEKIFDREKLGFFHMVELGFSIAVLTVLSKSAAFPVTSLEELEATAEIVMKECRANVLDACSAMLMISVPLRELENEGVIQIDNQQNDPNQSEESGSFYEGVTFNLPHNQDPDIELLKSDMVVIMDESTNQMDYSKLTHEQSLYLEYEDIVMRYNISCTARSYFVISIVKFDKYKREYLLGLVSDMKVQQEARIAFVLPIIEDLTNHGVLSAAL